MLLTRFIHESSSSTRELIKIFHEEAQSSAAFEHLSTQDFHEHSRQSFLLIWTAVAHHIRREVGDDDVLLNALWKLLPP